MCPRRRDLALDRAVQPECGAGGTTAASTAEREAADEAAEAEDEEPASASLASAGTVSLNAASTIWQSAQCIKGGKE